MMRRLGIDVGGTFTDVAFYDDESGTLRRAKVSTTPQAPEEGVIDGLNAVGVDPLSLDLFLHGTTMVTNLIIERRGGPVGLITTRGHKDLLEIGLSYRDQPFNLQWEKQEPLVPARLRVEVDERMSFQGEVLRPLDEAQVSEAVKLLQEQGVEAIAVFFLHSFVNPEHEQRTADIIQQLAPKMYLSLSSEVDPRIREYFRLSTTVLNAYAMPRTSKYVEHLHEKVPVPSGIKYMHSGGGVMPEELARRLPIHLVASGPSGGVRGASFVGSLVGADDIIAMDMGGTSCDVSIIKDGEPGHQDVVWVEFGIPARVRALAVRSIGAGGGSIAWIDAGGKLRVGPESAGAEPGPACYGRGGEEPTVTDANLVLGILNPESFLGGKLNIKPERAETAVSRLAEQLRMPTTELASGIFKLVNVNMANAIRQITVEKGIDPREFTLVAYGGAGGQHAASVAEEFNIGNVLFPNNASVLSAFGLMTADLSFSATRTLLAPLDGVPIDELRQVYHELEATAAAPIVDDSAAQEGDIEIDWAADVRYQGQLFEVLTPVDRDSLQVQTIYESFEGRHEQEFGVRMGDPAELVNIHVTATRRLQSLELKQSKSTSGTPSPREERYVTLFDQQVPVYEWGQLNTGATVHGPAIVEEVDSTVLIPAKWQATLDPYRNLSLTQD